MTVLTYWDRFSSRRPASPDRGGASAGGSEGNIICDQGRPRTHALQETCVGHFERCMIYIKTQAWNLIFLIMKVRIFTL